MRAWRHRRSRRSGWVSSAGILSCQVETPLRVFLYSCGTSYLRSQAVLQCTACGRVPEQHHRPVGCRWPMRAQPTTGPGPPVAGSRTEFARALVPASGGA